MPMSPEKAREYGKRYRAEVAAGLRQPGKGTASLRKGADLTCAWCKSAFYRSPANRLRGANEYCSRPCMAAAYEGRFVGEKSPRFKGTDTDPCDNCEALVARPHWAKKEREHVFCDRSCFGEWKSKNWSGEGNPVWRGGHDRYYGANWLRQAREARRRDGHTCQYCGVAEETLRRALDVHHIRPFRFFKVARCREANALSNLISLCDRCHTHLERLSDSGQVHDWPTLRKLGQEGSAARPATRLP